jgi:hypothetical protein
MLKGVVSGVVCAGMFAVSMLAMEVPQTGGIVRASAPAAAGVRTQAARKPAIRGGADARRAWLGAEHNGLIVQKIANRVDESLSIELRYREDVVLVGIDAAAAVTVTRGGRAVRVESPEAYADVQQLLAGSEAAFATRVLLAERESVSDLQPPEMTLLSAAAFVASLAGDVDAPRRLAARFMDKHRGRYRVVRLNTCFEEYSSEASAAWNDMQACVDEANQDAGLFNRAYRRVACNTIWLVRAESAWIEYIGCLGPGQLLPQ